MRAGLLPKVSGSGVYTPPPVTDAPVDRVALKAAAKEANGKAEQKLCGCRLDARGCILESDGS